MTFALRKFSGRPLAAGAALVALAAFACSAMIAVAAQSVPDAFGPSGSSLDATIGGKVRQLAVLTCNINRWGCDRVMYATSVEGCRQLNAEAHRLAAELQELKAEAGDRWTSEKQAAAEASAPQAPPSRPKPYTYRARTNPNMSYRTLCVRLCDGFYYPLSEASQPQSFLTDEQKCQSSCSSPTKLFYSLDPAEDAEQMVALTGERYGELPNAFRYRTEYVDACACKPKPWSAEAKAEFERRAVLATRTQAERIVAEGAGEVAKVLAENDARVAQGRAGPRDAKVRFSQSAVARARHRAFRYGAGLFAPSPRAANEPPQRRFFLFRNRD